MAGPRSAIGRHLTRKSGVLGSIPGLATYFRFSFCFFKKDSCQLLAKVCARSTGKRLGGLNLPRKSVVRLTDRPDMTLDVYRGRKTTIQQQQQLHLIFRLLDFGVHNQGQQLCKFHFSFPSQLGSTQKGKNLLSRSKIFPF